MNDLKSRREVLEEKICDLEATLAQLKSQLKVETERDQHEAIEHLEDYLGAIDNKHANLQEFFKVLKEEIAQLFGKSPTKTGTES